MKAKEQSETKPIILVDLPRECREGDMGWDVARSVWAVVIGCFELGTLLAVDFMSGEVFGTHVGRSSTGLTKEGSSVLERINDVNISWVASQRRVGTRVLLGEVKWTPSPVGASILTGVNIIDAVLIFVNAPSGVGPFDEITNVGELVDLDGSSFFFNHLAGSISAGPGQRNRDNSGGRVVTGNS